MIIIKDIIDTLIDNSGTLTDALLKTKVLAFKLKNQELLSWTNNEINGYGNQESLPDYRIIGCSVVGTVQTVNQRAENYPIPLGHFPKKTQESLTTMYIQYGVAVLESEASNVNRRVGVDISPEFYGALSERLSGQVIHASRIISTLAYTQILAMIKSKLLDFMLALDNEIDVNVENISDNNDIIDKASNLFNSTIFGDNTTIIVGSGNIQNVKNNIKKGDFGILEKALKENNVSEPDIAELKKIIDVDVPSHTEKTFGTKVNLWIKKMFGKAIDATWKISIEVAGKVLSSGISNYYGW